MYQRYTVSTVYVVRAMRSGAAVRISIPRDVQRHLGLRVGENLVIDLEDGGAVRVWKLQTELLREGRGGRPGG